MDSTETIEGGEVRPFKFKGIKTTALGKEFNWWSIDHEAELKKFVRDNFNDSMFEKKLKLYLDSYNAEDDKESARIYALMCHQLYFEMLEYFIILLMTFKGRPIDIPLVIMKAYPKDVSTFAEELISDDALDIVGQEVKISGKAIGLTQKIYSLAPVEDKYEELLIFPLYRTISYAVGDYLDEFYKNSYNSIKHGNRGSLTVGDLSVSDAEGNKTSLLNTEYAFEHPRLFNIDKSNSIVQRIATFFDPKQIFLRCSIILLSIKYIHNLYRIKILNADPQPIEFYQFSAVENAWTGFKNNGNFIENSVASFAITSDDPLEADIGITVTLNLRLSAPLEYSHPLQGDLDVSSEK